MATGYKIMEPNGNARIVTTDEPGEVLAL